MSDTDVLLPCPLRHAAAPVEVQRQRLALAGLDTVDIGFGYCGACGHIYQVRTVSDALLSRHYEQFSNYTAFDPEAARAAPVKASTLRLFRLAEAHAGKRGLAYEVGCATGFHLAQFARTGWGVAGCDLSPKACAQAHSIFSIEADCGPEAEILPKRKNLDLVYFSHVLEHLRDPLAALMRARAALADDGMVMLEVPCAVAAHLLPPGWFTFEHLQYFSEDAVFKLLEHAGFKALEIRIALKAELYPVIAAIAVKGDPRPFTAEPWAVARTQSFLADFIRRDEKLWNDVAKRIGNLSGGIFIWGAGVHTAQLMDNTPIDARAEIVGIIDSDSQKWGATQAGKPVISPEEFLARDGNAPVVISSYASEVEIAAGLRASGIAENRIVRLYH